MKIGILAFRQHPYISANTAIAYTIGEFLSDTEEVVYIGRKQDESQNGINSYNGIKIRFLNDIPKPKPTRAENVLSRFGLYGIAMRKDIRSLKEIVKTESLDALICVSAPNENAIVAGFAGLSIPIYLYQLDPFYNQMDRINESQRKLFCRILPAFSHIFTTDLLQKEYLCDECISKYYDKISIVEFPKLMGPIKNRCSENEKTLLLYTGTLYHSIRDPHILATLKAILPEDYEIIFCGTCDREDDMQELLSSGIECKGYCSQSKLKEYVEHADVLINIGNSVRNQLGSKIIDYISTGKPILNLTQFDECPTQSVLQDYSFKCSVRADAILEEKTRIIQFVESTKGQRMTWDDIRKKYMEYTPEYVSQRILGIIKE